MNTPAHAARHRMASLAIGDWRDEVARIFGYFYTPRHSAAAHHARVSA